MKAGWHTTGVSVKGSRHERMGLPCQDAHGYISTPAGFFLAAVADGASSAKYADRGSTLAVRTAIGYLIHELGETADWKAEELERILRRAFHKARIQVLKYARRAQVGLDELASTLILVAASRHAIAAAQLGDGAVVIGDSAGGFFALTTPYFGEFLNETTFLTTPGAISRIQTNTWSGTLRHVSLFSDGLQMLALKMPESSPHPPFFLPLFDAVSGPADASEPQDTLQSFLSSERVRKRTDDDVTLVLSTYWGP